MPRMQLKLEHSDQQSELVEVNTDELNINEEDLETEACRQIQLMVEYGKIYSVTKSRSLRAENDIKIVEALIASTYRKECADNGVKTTENSVTEYVHKHQDYILAVDERARTSAIATLAYAWWSTVQTRAEMLKLIGYRQNTEIKYAD